MSTPARAEQFNGYYQIQSQFLESASKCLEGNKPGAGSALGGAAFMDSCKNASGQLWKIVPAGNGYYRFQTQFLEKDNKCLEGNRPGKGSALGGAAFMDSCRNVSGQLFRLVPQCKPEPGWSKCRAIGSPKIEIYGSAAVSDAAMDAVRKIYTDMTHRLESQYSMSKFDGYKVYITNGEPWSQLATMSPIGTMWREVNGVNRGDELRGGTSPSYLWISEQMICKKGVATRNKAFAEGRRDQPDTEQRTFDQVVHEFAHAIDFKFGLRSEITSTFGGARPEESWAWAVQHWFSTPASQLPAAHRAMVQRVFGSSTKFSCSEDYRR